MLSRGWADMESCAIGRQHLHGGCAEFACNGSDLQALCSVKFAGGPAYRGGILKLDLGIRNSVCRSQRARRTLAAVGKPSLGLLTSFLCFIFIFLQVQGLLNYVFVVFIVHDALQHNLLRHDRSGAVPSCHAVLPSGPVL